MPSVHAIDPGRWLGHPLLARLTPSRPKQRSPSPAPRRVAHRRHGAPLSPHRARGRVGGDRHHLLDARPRPCQVPRAHLLAEPVRAQHRAPIGWAPGIARTDPEAMRCSPPTTSSPTRRPFAPCSRAPWPRQSGLAHDHRHVPDARPRRATATSSSADLHRRAARTASRTSSRSPTARAPKPSWPEAVISGTRACSSSGARVMLESIRRHLPELADGFAALDAAAEQRRRGAGARSLPRPPSDLHRHGVMEKADRVAVVAGELRLERRGKLEGRWELAGTTSTATRSPRHGHGRRGEQPGEGPLHRARRRFALLGGSQPGGGGQRTTRSLMPRAARRTCAAWSRG